MASMNDPRLKPSNAQLRACPRCQAPMLLMIALPTPKKNTITKKYECYVCHSDELIEEATKIAGWLASKELSQPR